MVLHGGADGSLKHYGHRFRHEYVWQWTRERLQSQLDLGKGEKMPTFKQLIELCEKAPDMLMNIEMKMPQNETLIN